MSVLIFKNVEKEGPGTIGSYLASNNIPLVTVDLSKNEPIPDTDKFTSMVIMGGPMSVNDHGLYPYIEEEVKLVRRFIAEDKKILGICLGAQIMAKALGSRVYKGRQEEIGWHDINLTEEGLNDGLIRSMAFDTESGELTKSFKVFHWHGETFDVPPYTVRIAGSRLYPNQAFRYKRYAYAFQFHIEVTREMIYDWFREDTGLSGNLRTETEKYYPEYYERAVKFYELFFGADTR
jgi:GMP synthase-like glutamine amidotransferase